MLFSSARPSTKNPIISAPPALEIRIARNSTTAWRGSLLRGHFQLPDGRWILARYSGGFMKRNVLCVVGSVFLSFALYAVALSIQLRYSRWGSYVTDPHANRTYPVASEHPEVGTSLRRTLIMTHVFVLPTVSVLVGCFAGLFATRPLPVSLLGIIPFRLFYLSHDGFYALAIISTLVDIGIATLAAALIARLKRPHALSSTG